MATVFYNLSDGTVRSGSTLDVNPQVPPDVGILHISEEDFRKFLDPPPPGKLLKVENGALTAVDPPKPAYILPGT